MRINQSIYLDYQATTPTDPQVIEAMHPFYNQHFANPHSAHIMGANATLALDDARDVVANFVNAFSGEVFFTSGATESNNHVIAGLILANKTNRNRILISVIEHKCIKEAAYFYASKFSYIVEEIPVLPSGQVDLNSYRNMLDDDVMLVCIMAVNNEIGTIQDIELLAKLAHDNGAFFHCDAAQAPMTMVIDVLALNVDFLSLSAHKIYGPKGIGMLYINSAVRQEITAFIHGGGQQQGLRSGTVPVPLCVGFAEAVKIIQNKGIQEQENLAHLQSFFLKSLKSKNIDFVLNGSLDKRHFGNLNLQFQGIDANSLLNHLQPYVLASTGSACNTGMIEHSYVLQALGLNKEQAGSSIRFSFGRFSDESQIIETVERIWRACN